MVDFDGGIDVMEALKLEKLGMDPIEAAKLLGLERLKRRCVELSENENETLEKLKKRREELI